MRSMFKRISLGVGVLSLLAVLVVPILTNAQQSGQGLEISPPLIDLKVDPGKDVVTEIRIRNVTNQPLVARAEYNDFVAAGEDGSPKILIDEQDSEKSPYSIKDWLDTIPEVTIQPNQQQVVKLTLHVPANAAPGGHYGVIRFTGRPPELDSSAVSLSASIGTLVLATVSGDIKEDASIAEMFTSQNNNKRSLFEYGPVAITTRFQNKGNVHIQPMGVIIVRDMFGRTVQSFKFNETKGNVLPSSTRKFDNSLQRKLLIGRYSAKADLVYGADSNIVSASTTFWVIPYKLIIFTILLILLVIFAIRQYNRIIIRKARKEQGDGSKTKVEKKKK